MFRAHHPFFCSYKTHPQWVSIGLWVMWIAWGTASPAQEQVEKSPSPNSNTENRLPKRSPFAWTLEEAKAQLFINPHDSYLQYVVMQLGRNAGHGSRTAREVDRISVTANRRRDVSLFSTFTGALAVQESLQLDTMTRRRNLRNEEQKPSIPITSLSGPSIKSHPWKEMLGGRNPKVSALSRVVPRDFYFVRFRRLTKLLELIEQGDLWARHLLDQSVHAAYSSRSSERIQKQLCIKTSQLSRPFYDLAVREVAITGSDLYVREGSDVTLLFSVANRPLFDRQMQSFLADAEKNHPQVTRQEGNYRGVPFIHLTAPRRAIHLFAADPTPDLHIRSNSQAALERIIDVLQGTTSRGEPVASLGSSEEFKYIRTLMPLDAEEEDGFAYLSDPFIRRMVGPEVKITELRRLQAYNHLRMIGHGQLLHRTQYGTKASSIKELQSHGCIPADFTEDPFPSPGGLGNYFLDPDSLTAVHSHYGTVHNLRPILEIPATHVTPEESEQYQQFRARYDRYWRTFFDPIALRVTLRPEQYRLETIVLPLIDNSIYSSLNETLGGDPEPLDTLPVPQGNILTINVRLKSKQWLLDILGELTDQLEFARRTVDRQADQKLPMQIIKQFQKAGLRNQIGFHLYDANPFFSISLPMLFSEMSGNMLPQRMMSDPELLLGGFLVSSLNSPVYLSIPVDQVEETDQFLQLLDEMLGLYSRQKQPVSWFRIDPDFSLIQEPGKPAIRCQAIRLGPVKWRVFWARIGNAIYIASKRFVLDDIRQAHAQAQKNPPKDLGPSAHGMVRMRAEHWDKILSEFQLGWAENNREASLNNISRIYGVARAVLSEQVVTGKKSPDALDLTKLSQQAQAEADQIYGVHFFCPSGGQYVLQQGGYAMENSVHGSVLLPRQGTAPVTTDTTTQLLSGVRQVTASLIFQEKGLHALLVIDRKPVKK